MEDIVEMEKTASSLVELCHVTELPIFFPIPTMKNLKRVGTVVDSIMYTYLGIFKPVIRMHFLPIFMTSFVDILCPRLGAERIGRISWLSRAPLGPIFMTGLP